MSREVEKLYLIKLAKPHKVNQRVGTIAVNKEQSITTM